MDEATIQAINEHLLGPYAPGKEPTQAIRPDNLYCIQATASWKYEPDASGIVWSTIMQIPTVWLDANCYGITDTAHAESLWERWLRDIFTLNAHRPVSDLKISVSAAKV